MKLENWNVCGVSDPYLAPERQVIRLQGDVSGHPRFADGTFVTTSCIVSVNGAEVTTKSGSVYTLGEPKANYVAWCEKNGCHVPTADEPLKLKG